MYLSWGCPVKLGIQSVATVVILAYAEVNWDVAPS